jgi:hypothetical protein
MSYRIMDAQPSHFVTTLADHGMIGGLLLLSLWGFPLASILRRSYMKLFAVPYVTSLVHVAAAYGSYQWPGLWIMLGLTLYLAEFGCRQVVEPVEART